LTAYKEREPMPWMNTATCKLTAGTLSQALALILPIAMFMAAAEMAAAEPASQTTTSGQTTTSVVVRVGSYGGRGAGKKRVPTVEQFNSGPDSPIVRVDAGNAEAFALSEDGTDYSFGQNLEGQLGLGNANEGSDIYLKASPITFPGNVKIEAIGEGREDGFAVDTEGRGWAWGRSPGGTRAREGAISSLCLGAVKSDVLAPREILGGLHDLVAVQGGGDHVLWLSSAGEVFGCGANEHGQLGKPLSVVKALTPERIEGLPPVVEISAGKAESCARTASGAVYMWGQDNHGQVGNGEMVEAVTTPYQLLLPGPASDISCGGNRKQNGTAMVLVNGVPYGMGYDADGEVGDGQTEDKDTPTVATELLGLELSSVVASGESSLALTRSGSVYAWGSNTGFAVGLPGESEVTLAPALLETGVAEISATSYDTLMRMG
jgi:alpha-tubulin suppressor-like RCC1 family protein